MHQIIIPCSKVQPKIEMFITIFCPTSLLTSLYHNFFVWPLFDTWSVVLESLDNKLHDVTNLSPCCHLSLLELAEKVTNSMNSGHLTSVSFMQQNWSLPLTFDPLCPVTSLFNSSQSTSIGTCILWHQFWWLLDTFGSNRRYILVLISWASIGNTISLNFVKIWKKLHFYIDRIRSEVHRNSRVGPPRG